MAKPALQLHIAPHLWALLLALLLALGAVPARADADRTELALPVRCTGPGCTVALYDAAGAEQARALLAADGEGVLRFSVSGVGRHVFTVRLLDRNSETRRYDARVYTIYVTAALSQDGTELLTAVFAQPNAEGKIEELVYENESLPGPGPRPTPTGEPTPTPSTEPTPTGEPTPTPSTEPTPTGEPTPTPSTEPTPTGEPTEPVITPSPSYPPGPNPSVVPTPHPTEPHGPEPSVDPEDPDDEDLDEDTMIDDEDVPLGPLPQTGQLWWPVPILAAAGLLCLTLGVRMRRKGRRQSV